VARRSASSPSTRYAIATRYPAPDRSTTLSSIAQAPVSTALRRSNSLLFPTMLKRCVSGSNDRSSSSTEPRTVKDDRAARPDVSAHSHAPKSAGPTSATKNVDVCASRRPHTRRGDLASLRPPGEQGDAASGHTAATSRGPRGHQPSRAPGDARVNFPMVLGPTAWRLRGFVQSLSLVRSDISSPLRTITSPRPHMPTRPPPRWPAGSITAAAWWRPSRRIAGAATSASRRRRRRSARACRRACGAASGKRCRPPRGRRGATRGRRTGSGPRA
jgi:hypothetical protein